MKNNNTYHTGNLNTMKQERRFTMKGLTKKACALSLFAIMTISPLSFASADTGCAVPEAPERPQVESYLDNDKITEYNNQVDAYNQAAQNYNISVDAEYDSAVQEAIRKNEEVAAHNAAEEQRVKDAEARNEQAIKDAEEANALIDEENAAGLAQAEQARDAQYNSDLAQYQKDMEQYSKDLKQYEYDVNMENRIKAAGYASVEQYNNAVNKAYNEPAAKAEIKNAAAPKLSASDTYSIEKSANPSGRMITVTVEHNFSGIDLSYKEEFQIDANDIITFKALCAPAESTNPGYATFYYNTDEAHKTGYWMESYSCVETNARYHNNGWECGDTHEISFKDGKNHAFDSEDIIVVYEYFWYALRYAKTYNVPNEPTMPTEPVKGEVSYESKPHVEANVEDIAQADIWSFVSDPVKKAYLDLLSHMELFQAPIVPKAEVTQTATPKNTQTTGNKIVQKIFGSESTKQETINDAATPLASKAETSAQHTVITDQATPKAAVGFWALINLIAAILTVLIGVLMAMFGLKKKDDDSDDENEESRTDNKIRVRILGMLLAGISVIVFILTEDMALPMQLVDKWTVLMIIMLAVEAVLGIASKKKVREEEEDRQADLIAA